MDIDFKIESELQNSALLGEMSELYSNNYGLWGKTAKNPGTRIKLNESRISKWVFIKHYALSNCRGSGTNISLAGAGSSAINRVDNEVDAYIKDSTTRQLTAAGSLRTALTSRPV